MAKSRNWHAVAMPPMQGGKSQLTVTGEVGAGGVEPRLERDEKKDKAEPGILHLICRSATDNDNYAKVRDVETITSQREYHDVEIDDANGKVLAKIKVEFSES
jgi:hypothetical protein